MSAEAAYKVAMIVLGDGTDFVWAPDLIRDLKRAFPENEDIFERAFQESEARFT